ncbi:hypothetical protein V0R50_26395 [Pseudomonas sp. 148P]|uniref:DUF3077 domain-containing protein n=1 Tax=Pseudomonas ulcerans TaxID=3115852 RepID=A0ABU7HZE4_9PSED|nr:MULTISPECIES: hypothetical protein [unclassified Pseudomonas]MEE1925314.1 hypothetical protein [Pseudomonas sp. 147P]MEE1936768.1 hypothetical protein [Pseudomonas sp. 148P]
MKKHVPDPPPDVTAPTRRLTTTHTHFATISRKHAPLFAIRAGVDIEDALAHLATALRAAMETNLQLCDLADRKHGDLLWATQQSLEIAHALTLSLLSSVESRASAG